MVVAVTGRGNVASKAHPQFATAHNVSKWSRTSKIPFPPPFQSSSTIPGQTGRNAKCGQLLLKIQREKYKSPLSFLPSPPTPMISNPHQTKGPLNPLPLGTPQNLKNLPG